MEDIKQELKALIVKSLRLTDITPADLRDDQQLMGGDLEIDSIDILQLILSIERRFGIKLVDGKFDKSVWKSINSLAETITGKMKAAKHA